MQKIMNNGKFLNRAILVILIVYFLGCLGITFIYISHYLGLSFLKKELSYGEILNSLTAISLAFLIPFFVEKRFNRNKTLSENLQARLNNLQKELELFILDIEKKCIESNNSQLAYNKLIINLKLRKIGLNINGFRKDSPKAYNILLISFAQFRKLTTTLVDPVFIFDTIFYKDTYHRYIDFDKCIEDVKLGIIENS